MSGSFSHNFERILTWGGQNACGLLRSATEQVEKIATCGKEESQIIVSVMLERRLAAGDSRSLRHPRGDIGNWAPRNETQDFSNDNATKSKWKN